LTLLRREGLLTNNVVPRRWTMPPRGVKKGTKLARQYEHIKDS